jgi:hypothetical protein
LIGLHAGAMKYNFLLMKIILPEIKPLFNQVYGIAFFEQGMLLKKLMRKKKAYPHV